MKDRILARRSALLAAALSASCDRCVAKPTPCLEVATTTPSALPTPCLSAPPTPCLSTALPRDAGVHDAGNLRLAPIEVEVDR